MSNIPKPSEVDTDNIIKPSLDEISADHRQVYEEYKKVREEKDLQEFLAKFKKDRQGNITLIEEIKFPPLQTEQVKPSDVLPFLLSSGLRLKVVLLMVTI